MRTPLIAVLSTMLTAGAMAQGTIDFVNVSSRLGIQAYVNRSDDPSPAGRLGAGYWAQLYVGPAGTPESSLVAVGIPVEFRNYPTTGAPSGGVNGGEVVTPFLRGGYPAVVQMRTWSGAAGRTYEAARATGLYYGQSGPITIVLGNDGGSIPTVPAPLLGLQPFMVVVPEPSTLALCALGLSVLLAARYKQSLARLTVIGGGRSGSRGLSTGRR